MISFHDARRQTGRLVALAGALAVVVIVVAAAVGFLVSNRAPAAGVPVVPSRVETSPTPTPVDPCTTGANQIVCENSRPGASPREWQISGSGDASIQGFSTDISVNLGSRIDFKVATDAEAYTVDVYRTGYYDGFGARKVVTVPVAATLPQLQPACVTDSATALSDCGNWAVSAGWDVPNDAVSGVYVALLTRSDTGGRSHITFVVRDDASRSEIVLQTADPTWQAYNTFGGASYYHGGSDGRAYKVSYNRPFSNRSGIEARDFYFAAEYPLVRFLERNGYDVSSQAGVDTDRAGSLLTNHRVFVSAGHDEYWSGAQRANVEAARDAGVNLAFFSGNAVFWRTRYEGSVDGTATGYRTLVCYKESTANAKIDPSSEWTGTWRDPRFASTTAGGGQPENALQGTIYMANDTDLPVTVSAAEGKLRLWRGTSLATLQDGESVELAPHTVGYESHEDVDNGFRPAGLVGFSTTTGPAPKYYQDFGNRTDPGTTTHRTTAYRAASGALVFSAGSIQWAWGLDETHDGEGDVADARMQQAVVNLLADMGVQPQTRMSGLVAAVASTDMIAPTALVANPDEGSVLANGQSVTATGTATDEGGGRVAAVEVSTDGGTSWHPASGTDTWRYTYRQVGQGAASILARATDDSLNTGPVSALRSISVSCPCSIFGTAVPLVPADSDVTAVEVGLRFAPSIDGFISGMRFYQGEGNNGPHTGTFWSATGQRLASVAFAAEASTGWRAADFATPVAVVAGRTYVVSYGAPQGRYAGDLDYFASGVSAPPLSAPGGLGVEPAGVWGDLGTFPRSTYRQVNYWVDVDFVPAG